MPLLFGVCSITDTRMRNEIRSFLFFSRYTLQIFTTFEIRVNEMAYNSHIYPLQFKKRSVRSHFPRPVARCQSWFLLKPNKNSVR